MHILLVEDNGTLANLFRVQLRLIDPSSTLVVTASKKETMDALNQETFDLIFIDMGLEGQLDAGVEILTELKRRRPAQRAGILSSNDINDVVHTSQLAGAEFYMVKPFTREGLRLVIAGDKEKLRHYRPDIGEGQITIF